MRQGDEDADTLYSLLVIISSEKYIERKNAHLFRTYRAVTDNNIGGTAATPASPG